MHEYEVAKGIVAAVENRAEGRLVRGVRVRAGVLLRISEPALSEAFAMAADDTVAAGARLDLIIEPVRLTCGICARTHILDGLLAACPACGGTDLAIEGGDGLRLESIHLAEAAHAPPRSPGSACPGGTD